MKAPKSMHTNAKKPKKKSPIFFEKTQSKRISRRKSTLSKQKFEKVEKFKKSEPRKESKEYKKRPSKKVANKKIVPKVFTLKKKILKVLESTLLPGQERLEKYMAQSGMASRREAKELIKKNLVTVNGKVIRNPGHGIITGKDKVLIVGGTTQNKEVVLLYKPRGIETMKTSPDSIDIHDRFPKFSHLSPVGRLDKDSEGLILLSNDGVLAKKMTAENSTIEKEYRVTVREDVMPVLLTKMERGIMLDKVMTKPCTTRKISQHEFTITLTEGRKHQVRRMANACSLTVTRLVRIRIGDLTIGKMTAGNFKKIPNEIIQEIKNIKK